MKPAKATFSITKREPFFITEGCGDLVRDQWEALKPKITVQCDDLASRLSKSLDKPIISMKDYQPYLKEIRAIQKALEPFTVRLYLSLKFYNSMENMPRVPCDVEKIKAVKLEVFVFKSSYFFLKTYSD